MVDECANDSKQGSRDDADAATINDLVELCLVRAETEGDSALESLCREHPQHAKALRRRFATLMRLGILEESASNRGAVDTPAAAEPIPERLGEFRLLTRLGAGGMGVVYLALQESLNRVVALKIVRPDHLYFAGARDRFRREVEAVARLQHPGIAHIHVVGEENGIPYFAMEPIRGATLGEVIAVLAGRDPATLSGRDLSEALERIMAARTAEQREAFDAGRTSAGAARGESSTDERFDRLFAGSWESSCLRIVGEVALALAHAHDRGVLHRDLKPSNVMLTPSGRVSLLDFGLATAEGSERITRSGAQLGSLAYMPPEQLDDAAAVDVRSDVYSLGATLYELLTLRLPFPEATADAMRTAIRAGAPLSPRRIHAGIDADTEVLCLAAMDRDPARRYPSAAAFAADIANVLAHRPIAARRPGPLLRTRRFLQRHPTASVTAALAFVSIVALPATLLWQQRRANRELEIEIAKTRSARDRASTNLRASLDALGRALRNVAANDLRYVPEAQFARRRMLEEARTAYEALVARNDGSFEARFEAARAQTLLSYVLEELGETANAAVANDRAIELLSALLAEAVATHAPIEALMDLRAELADAHESRGAKSVSLGATAEALDDFEAGLEHARRALEHPADEDRRRRCYGSLLARIGSVHQMARHLDEAEAKYREALEFQTETATRAPSLENRHAVAYLENNFAELLRQAGRASDALEMQRASVVHYEALASESTTTREILRELEGARLNLAKHLAAAGAVDDSIALLNRAIEGLEPQCAENPRDAFTTRLLGTVQAQLGGTMQKLGRLDEAEVALRRSIELHDALRIARPEEIRNAVDVAVARANLGGVFIKRGDSAKAGTEFKQALELLDGALAASPERTDWRSLRETVATQVARVAGASAGQ